MIEAIMFFGLGFFVACLLAVVVLPLVHARAVRLTRRRIEAMTPVSIAEIQADKDHLRAEFAVATRQLELTLENVKDKAVAHLVDIGRKTEIIARLQAEKDEVTARLASLSGNEQSLQQQLLSTAESLTEKTNLLNEIQAKLAEREAELANVRKELTEGAVAKDSLRVEMIALQTQAETLRGQIMKLEERLTEKDRTIEERGTAVAAAAHALAEMKRERDALKTEIEAKRGEAAAGGDEHTREKERAENALLRERIADVAAEVARLTMQLEGTASPIPALLGDARSATNGAGHGPDLVPDTSDWSNLSLADRIRALQNKTVRVPASN
jgi:DNA repair exonuclease SbcCD ATPase subunit